MLVAPGAALTAGKITPVQTVEATLQPASHEAALDGDMACWSTDLRPRPSLPHHPAWIPRAQNIVWSARPDGVKSWWQATERPVQFWYALHWVKILPALHQVKIQVWGILYV